MEKYSQFRDRATGIAPFLPVVSEPAGIYLPIYICLFLFRLPFFVTLCATYFLFLQWFPLGSLFKKALLWMIMGIPGIWWIDLQIDGVKKGSLAKNESRVPSPSNVIASSFTSPLDSLYLAAIFDPIFTVSYPHTRQVEYISLFGAILRALSKPKEFPSKGAKMTDIKTLVRYHPKRIIVVFPECTTTNGRGTMPFSPSLLATPPRTKIFPISLRYTAADITTPVSGEYWTFIWNLLSHPTHCIRVRIAEAVYNTSISPEVDKKFSTDALDSLGDESAISSSTETLTSLSDQDMTEEEQKVLHRVGEALARLGRVKRVSLTVTKKSEFIETWSKRKK
ncbi:hypothetical protein BJ878DRAFT_565485 [Calycina marina]|uniref:Phospholipid/glycerol acyltransferase domain-containing protein n=1 Tax=Calycina marina TaxID=1763456 RepID=A0A9P7Z7I7_9HELO|nr:hypothetical protein BJ878DRAFT_565485 [Calycina marina]